MYGTIKDSFHFRLGNVTNYIHPYVHAYIHTYLSATITETYRKGITTQSLSLFTLV